MAKRLPARDVTPPNLPPRRAIELIRKQIQTVEELSQLARDHPDVNKWVSTTEALLRAAFGSTSGMSSNVRYAHATPVMNMPESYYQLEHQKGLLNKKAVLESAIEQLEMLMPQAALAESGHYHFHAEVERVSGDLFRDGHYKQAAFEAYVRVIEEVKRRTGLPLDGDSLMNQALGCDGGRIPALKFNTVYRRGKGRTAGVYVSVQGNRRLEELQSSFKPNLQRSVSGPRLPIACEPADAGAGTTGHPLSGSPKSQFSIPV